LHGRNYPERVSDRGLGRPDGLLLASEEEWKSREVRSGSINHDESGGCEEGVGRLLCWAAVDDGLEGGVEAVVDGKRWKKTWVWKVSGKAESAWFDDKKGENGGSLGQPSFPTPKDKTVLCGVVFTKPGPFQLERNLEGKLAIAGRNFGFQCESQHLASMTTTPSTWLLV
jgi:hypothetical protein